MTLVVLVAFGASQYAAATGIAIGVTGSEFVGTSPIGEKYMLEVTVNNPTLLPISVGEVVFNVSNGGEPVGSGVVESFVMPIMGEIIVGGTYYVDSEGEQPEASVRISGTAQYDLMFGSISIPFEYDTVGGFIHRT